MDAAFSCLIRVYCTKQNMRYDSRFPTSFIFFVVEISLASIYDSCASAHDFHYVIGKSSTDDLL